MKVHIYDNYQQLSTQAAQCVAKQLKEKKASVLGLATGSTPRGMYAELVRFYKAGKLDFSSVTTFNLDEYYGISKENKHSYYYYMRENLFQYINIDIKNVHIPNGLAENVEEECLRYEKEITGAGGLDLIVLGIGRNGHIGFNEPNIQFETMTHLVRLDKDTIKANTRFFEKEEEVPTTAISMGIKTIMQSKKILLLANGRDKASAIHKALLGKVRPDIPASILQLHNNVSIFLDKEAARFLSPKKDKTKRLRCAFDYNTTLISEM